MFDHMKRALKPGGVLVMQGYTPDLLEAHFGDMEILALESYERELDEGPAHRGPSALIGLVARHR